MVRAERGDPGDSLRRRQERMALETHLSGSSEGIQPRIITPGEKEKKGYFKEVVDPKTHESSEIPQGNLQEQLHHFLGRGESSLSYNVMRGWLKDDDISVYVRRNRRPYGPPSGSLAIDGDNKAVLPTVECLEVATVEFTEDTLVRTPKGTIASVKTNNLAPWEVFVDEAVAGAQNHGVRLLYVEDVTDKRLLRWFKDNIAHADPNDPNAWQTPQEYSHPLEEDGRSSFFRWIISDQRK